MTPALQLKLFGSPQISYQGQPLTGFVSTKVRALLIYLAVTARPHSRDHLAELLWADTPASTRTNLRKALSNLRQLIGEALVEDAKESITLNPQLLWVDVIEFGRLSQQGAAQEAIALYQADFLTGFNLSVSYEFEAWALSEQSCLKSQMVELLRRLATQHTSTALSAGESRNTLSQAILAVHRLLDLEPWHEENHRWLMELLAKDGQRSAALAHFEVCKRVLWDELAVEPSAETLALLARIQRTSESVNKPRPKPTAISKPEFPLIGRETELQIIQQAWQRCLQHGVHFISIAGEAGIGKTRLTEEVRTWVEAQGYASVYARSYAAEGALAYSPVVDWLRSEAIRPLLGQLDTVWLNAVARLLPELLTFHPNLMSTKVNNDGVNRRLFLESLARAILISREPILLVIDDLQWCDRETLAWLRFLLRFDPDHPLLVIGTYRVEEVDEDHWLQTLLLSLRRDEVVSEIELGMLSEANTAALIYNVAVNQVSREQITNLWKATTGHPLFVIESLHSGGEQDVQKAIPPKIQSVIQSRFMLLSAKARTLAELAAVTGRSFTSQLLVQASKQTEASVISGLDELWQRRIIVERESNQFDFSHDRIRENVYASMSPVNRPRLHLQIAQALEILYAHDLSEWNGQIATHYQLAGKLTAALPYFAEAVQITYSQRWAFNETLAIINRVLQFSDQLPETETNIRHLLALRYCQYGVIRRTKGNTSPQLREITEHVSQLSKKVNDPTYDYMARAWSLQYYNYRAESIQARTIAEANLLFAQTTGDESLILEAYGELAQVCFIMGDLIMAKSLFDQPLTMVKKVDTQAPLSDPVRTRYIELNIETADSCYLLGHLNQAKQFVQNGLALAKGTKHPGTYIYILHTTMRHCIFIEQQKHSIKNSAEEMYTLCQEFEFVVYLEWSKLYQGWALVLEGDYEAGITKIEQVVNYFEQIQLLSAHVYRLGLLTESYRLAKRYDEGKATIQKALNHADSKSDRFWLPELYRLQGELLHSSGAEIPEVEESYQKSLEISRQQSSRLLELRTSVSLARLWQTQGKHAEAHQLLSPIYHWFTEGFDMPDLVDAKKLLDELTTTVAPSH